MAPATKKKGQKKSKKVKENDVERELIYKDVDESQEYAQVIKLLGNCRCELQCIDGISRLGHIRGSMTKKKIWISVGDIVLVSLRDFEDKKCDILYLYKNKESKTLKKEGHLPENIKINEDLAVNTENEDIGFDFETEEEAKEREEQELKDNFKNNFDENFDKI